MKRLEDGETIGANCHVSFRDIINNASMYTDNDEINSELDIAAKKLMDIYKAYRRAGFNEGQAIKLVSAGLHASLLMKK